MTTKKRVFGVQFGKSNFLLIKACSLSYYDTSVDAYRLMVINLNYGSAKSFGRVRPLIGLTVR